MSSYAPDRVPRLVERMNHDADDRDSPAAAGGAPAIRTQPLAQPRSARPPVPSRSSASPNHDITSSPWQKGLPGGVRGDSVDGASFLGMGGAAACGR